VYHYLDENTRDLAYRTFWAGGFQKPKPEFIYKLFRKLGEFTMDTTPILQPSSLRRRRRRLTPLRVLSAVVALLLLAVPAISGYVGYNLTHPKKKAVEKGPESYQMASRDIAFQSEDGLTLRGWFIPAAGEVNDELVIMAHGYTGNRSGDKPALPTAKALRDSGISVLMFDFRNSGESDGDMTTVGVMEKSDLLQAVKFAEAQGYGKHGIGFLGFSMGAATSLAAGAEAPEVKALVVDSPFADLTDYLHENMPYWTHLPDVPFTRTILWELPMITGHDTDEMSPIGSVEKLRDRPILFIHGGSDQAIPKSNSEEMLQALGNPQDELWSVEGARHVGTYELGPEAYMRKVVGFFQKHL
jgi:dipeptidyl aminopeptidase/acylaminoacyl peptidase